MNPKGKSLFENVYVLIFSALLFVFVGYSAFTDVLFYFTKVDAEGRVLKINKENSGAPPYKITVSYFNQFVDHGEVSIVSVDKDFARTIFRDKVEPISYGKLYADTVYFNNYKSPGLFTLGLDAVGLLILLLAIYFSGSALKKTDTTHE
ncbi:MAG: hypothetical protein H7289_16080 [Mucilaginibacter sp.]|nr:hypothetical protein [Mucilaginibacter sp.]